MIERYKKSEKQNQHSDDKEENKAYLNAKKTFFKAFTSEKQTEGYQWEGGYNKYTLGMGGADAKWYGPEEGTLVVDATGDKIKLGYNPTEPQRPKSVSMTESFKMGLHAMNVFLIHPDKNVEGSEKFQKAVLGYAGMVGGAFAMEAAEPYLAEGALRAMEYSGKASDMAMKFVIDNPKFYNLSAQISSSILEGPDPLKIPGNPSMISETFKIMYMLYQNRDVILNTIKRTNHILDVEPIPLNPADKTNFQRPYIPELKLRTNIPAVNQLPEPPVLKPKN